MFVFDGPSGVHPTYKITIKFQIQLIYIRLYFLQY